MTIRHGAIWAALLAGFSDLVGCGGAAETNQLTGAELMDPTKCRGCHPTQYADWSGSMHAYASDDPVFRAMNQRAERESNGSLGTFCLNCHAPMAVRQNLTTDGSNLDGLPASAKGVTCFFCHSIDSVTGTHNDPIALLTSGILVGPFDDPAPGAAHGSAYSTFLDGSTPDSASGCGSCHDIQNLEGAHAERTFAEWQSTVFSQTPGGESCAECHMSATDGAASSISTNKVRRLHGHGFPAVDLAVEDFPPASSGVSPQNTTQQQGAATLLATALQATVCLDPTTKRLLVTLDNVGAAGHDWPSGATPDRRAWVSLTAYVAGNVIYASGNTAPAGAFPSALPLEGSADPDLWLIRDCLYDASGAAVSLFWQASTITTNQLPGALIQTVDNPLSYATHMIRSFPSGATAQLSALPDHVTLDVHLQAIGDDVLSDLVASGDLDPSVPPLIARYTLGGSASVDWTPATAQEKLDPNSGVVLECVTTGTYATNTTSAVSHAACVSGS
jgi:cytochrome c554/c'-like protein